MLNIKHFLFLVSISLCFCSVKKQNNAGGKSPSTFLTIIQDKNEYKIDSSQTTITLKARPFRLFFHSKNTGEVFLHASTDSISYIKALGKEWSKLLCFNSDQTFSESSKNTDMEILVCDNELRGYHCLFAKAEPEFIRFDSVKIFNKHKWLGVRTVNQVTMLNTSLAIPCDSLKNKTIYLTYSPGIEKQGYGLKLNFR